MTMTIETRATQTLSTSTYSHPAANTDETPLFAALAEYEYRIGQTLKMLYGEYTYLGDHGKEGDGPAQKDREAVIAFFMLSEMDSAQFKKKTQYEALPEISEEPLKEAEAKRLNARENEDNTVQPTPDQETKRTNALTGPQENAFVRFS